MSPFPPVRFRHCSRIATDADCFGVLEYISGVILYHETLSDFQLGPVLSNRGIIPGVRADTDAHPLPISPIEPATQGLDDLLPRLRAAAQAGARFSKWRAPILCNSSTLPTHAALEAQAESLARFAAISLGDATCKWMGLRFESRPSSIRAPGIRGVQPQGAL